MDSFIVLAILLIPAYLLQVFFGFRQMKRFSREYSLMRRQGRVAIGRKPGKIVSGSIVLLSLNQEGCIQSGRKLQGTTVAAKFKDFDILNGREIDSIQIKDPELSNEFKGTKKAVIDAVNNYNLYVNGEEIPEKRAPLSALAYNLKNIFKRNREELT